MLKEIVPDAHMLTENEILDSKVFKIYDNQEEDTSQATALSASQVSLNDIQRMSSSTLKDILFQAEIKSNS